jgi:hypothetical protein
MDREASTHLAKQIAAVESPPLHEWLRWFTGFVVLAFSLYLLYEASSKPEAWLLKLTLGLCLFVFSYGTSVARERKRDGDGTRQVKPPSEGDAGPPVQRESPTR